MCPRSSLPIKHSQMEDGSYPVSARSHSPSRSGSRLLSSASVIHRLDQSSKHLNDTHQKAPGGIYFGWTGNASAKPRMECSGTLSGGT